MGSWQSSNIVNYANLLDSGLSYMLSNSQNITNGEGQIHHKHYLHVLSLSFNIHLQFAGYILRLWPFFYSKFFIIFFQQISPLTLATIVRFLKHIFVGFKEFTSLVCWCNVMFHHWPQGPTLFRRVRWDFTCVQCNMCTDMGPPVLSPI